MVHEQPAAAASRELSLQVRVVADYLFKNLNGATEQERVIAALEILRSQEADEDVQITIANQHIVATVSSPDGCARQYEVKDIATREVAPSAAADNPASQALLPMVLVTVDQASRVAISTDSALMLCVINGNSNEQQAIAGVCEPTEFSTHLSSVFRLAKSLETSKSEDDRLQLAQAINQLILRRRH